MRAGGEIARSSLREAARLIPPLDVGAIFTTVGTGTEFLLECCRGGDTDTARIRISRTGDIGDVTAGFCEGTAVWRRSANSGDAALRWAFRATNPALTGDLILSRPRTGIEVRCAASPTPTTDGRGPDLPPHGVG